MSNNIELDQLKEKQLFEKYPLFEKIGRDNFEIKMWILLKGIEKGDGSPIFITALGHKPCTAMLAKNVQPKEIIDILQDLHNRGIIFVEASPLMKPLHRYYVLFDSSHELNKIILKKPLESYFKDGSECRDVLIKLGFHANSSTIHQISQQAKKAIFWLNELNGLGTGKLIKILLWFDLDSATNILQNKL